MELNRRELNVLRRLLNRPDVKPQDVAQLGLARLEAAQGMGVKGLANVLEWLSEHGYPLRAMAGGEDRAREERLSKRLTQAQQLLEQWGWQVRRPDGEGADGARHE